MHHVCHPVLLDRLQEARHVEHVALLEIDRVEDVADQPVVAVARVDDRSVPFLDELAAGFGADDAHAAGDQDFHGDYSILAPTALISASQCLESRSISSPNCAGERLTRSKLFFSKNSRVCGRSSTLLTSA